MNPISLEQLTVWDATPPEMIEIAAQLGCDAVSLWVQSPRDDIAIHPVLGDTPMRRALTARLADTGVQIYNLEVFALTPQTNVADFLPALESGAALGAKKATAIVFDPDPIRVLDHFSQLCAFGSRFGLGVDIEFLAMSEVRNFHDAMRLVKRSKQANAGIVVDSLHVVRTGSPLAEIAMTDPRFIGHIQICDGPLVMPEDQWMFEGFEQRQIPGDGEFPLVDFINALPMDVMVGVEVPMKNLMDLGVLPLERARRAVEATRRILTQRMLPC